MPTLVKVDIFIFSIKVFIEDVFNCNFYYSSAAAFPAWRSYMLLFIITQNKKFKQKFMFSSTKSAKKDLSNQMHCRWKATTIAYE